MIVESPTLISACMMVPSGRFMGGYFSAAPKACLRNRIVLSTPSLMRYGVTFRYPSGILLTMVSLHPCARNDLASKKRSERSTGEEPRESTPVPVPGVKRKLCTACRGMPLRENFQTVRRGPHRRSCTPRATNLSRAEIIRFEIEAKLDHDCLPGSGADGRRAGAWHAPCGSTGTGRLRKGVPIRHRCSRLRESGLEKSPIGRWGALRAPPETQVSSARRLRFAPALGLTFSSGDCSRIRAPRSLRSKRE